MPKDTNLIGILTLHGYYNYGNRLQNYALSKIIKDLGFDVETIIIKNVPCKDRLINIFRKKLKVLCKISFNTFCKEIYYRVYNTVYYQKNKSLLNKREEVFKDFSKKYLFEKFYYDTYNSLETLSESCVFFITGSDQVWNPLYFDKLPIYFLTFTDKSKRIAYAPSFGVEDLPEEYKDNYKAWLSGMHSLSVREEVGAKIIKSLIGQAVDVLIDPTLILTKEEWLQISKIHLAKPKERYILTYFLGDLTGKDKREIRKFSKSNSLQLINLANLKDKTLFTIGPAEFIDYINSASLFLTDSFHGVTFSILMETPFLVYKRKNQSKCMYSRLETLLSTLDLKSREKSNIKLDKQVFNMDFSHTHQILNLERDKALEFLKKSLKLINEVSV